MSKRFLSYLGLPEKHQGLATIWLLCLVFIIVSSMKSGCGGCVLCGADVKTTPVRESGNATIEVQNLLRLASPAGTKTVSIGYSGTLIAEAEGTGEGSFNVSRSYEITQNNINPAPSIERKNLKPGRWEIRVQVGDWNASCQGDIGKNRGTTFTFNHGQPGCAVH